MVTALHPRTEELHSRGLSDAKRVPSSEYRYLGGGSQTRNIFTFKGEYCKMEERVSLALFIREGIRGNRHFRLKYVKGERSFARGRERPRGTLPFRGDLRGRGREGGGAVGGREKGERGGIGGREIRKGEKQEGEKQEENNQKGRH